MQVETETHSRACTPQSNHALRFVFPVFNTKTGMSLFSTLFPGL